MVLHSPASLKKALLPYLKIGTFGPCESSPFVFGGKLYTVTSYVRAHTGDVERFRIDGMLDRPVIDVTSPGIAYPVPYVEDGTIYVFGTDETHSYISVMTSTDLVNWTTPVVLRTSTNGDNYYNVTVCKTPTGYAMAAETINTSVYSTPNSFFVQFLTSPDLATWTMGTQQLYNGGFVNCPTMRYYDGKYYVLYMTLIPEPEYPQGRHMTLICRSADLVTWEHGSGYPDGSTVPMAPDSALMDGTNTSDVDMIEYEGKTYFTYARGDQFNWTWLEVSTAVYDGTEKQFLQSFFPVNP